MYRLGAFNPSVHTNHNMVMVQGITYESLLEDEETQINGFVHVIDSSGIGLRSDSISLNRNYNFNIFRVTLFNHFHAT